MILSQLLENVENSPFFSVCQPFPNQEVYTFRPFPDNEIFQEHILYIGWYFGLPAQGNSLPLNFCCLLPSEEDLDFQDLSKRFPNSNFIFSASYRSLGKVYDYISDFFLAEARYSSQIERLVAASNSNLGLQHLIDVSYKITGCPTIVIDSSYRVLAMSFGSNATVSELMEQKENKYLTEQNFERMTRDGIFERLRKAKNKTLYGKAHDSSHFWLDSLIYSHNTEVAELGMMETDHKFSYYDFEFIKLLKQQITWEMQKESFFPQNHGLMHSIFLSELLEQKFADPQVVEQRRRMLNWKKAAYLYIFTVFFPEQRFKRRDAEIFSLQVLQIFPDSRWVITDTNLIFLIMKDFQDMNEFSQDAPLSRHLQRNNVYGIVSNCFQKLTDVRKYYEQTLAVREFRRLDERKLPISFYVDYYIFHIAKIISRSQDLSDFYHPIVPVIANYDKKNHSNYLETLQEYLNHVDDPTTCSENLGIHKNTFFYRMNKLRSLFSIHLDDGQERMKIQITLEFMKLKKN